LNISYLRHPPSKVLSDGDIALSLPSPDDVRDLAVYGAAPELLEGVWVSGSSPDGDSYVWARTRLDEFLAGWREPGGQHGATLAVRKGGRLVGFVYMSPRPGAALELSYGIAPPERGRGLATQAAEMAACWALGEGFDRVHLYVDADHGAGHRVAVRAGFQQVDRVETYIEPTGETFMQVIYERMHLSPRYSSTPSPNNGLQGTPGCP
jgi:RimJ/RimL family protein N-acetyltransferase